jgi:hypothetical protein
VTSRISLLYARPSSLYPTISLSYVLWQDFNGNSGDAPAARRYFKQRFVSLAQGAGRSEERKIYVQFVAPLYRIFNSYNPFSQYNNRNGHDDARGGNAFGSGVSTAILARAIFRVNGP